MRDIKVGDTYFIFDGNNRVYKDGKGAPIYREYFVEVEITSETSRSWVLGKRWDKKIPKSAPWSILYTADMVEDEVWKHENRWKISNAVERINDVLLLRKIATLIEFPASKTP